EEPERLRAVDERQDAALARDAADLLRRKQIADRAREVRERDDFRPRRERLGERLDVVVRPRMWIRRRNVDDGESEARRLLLPRGVIARMIVGRQQHFVAGL